jgi:hypothetical protein
MSRFKVGDRVLVLSKFVAVNGADRGVVSAVKKDASHSILDEYTLSTPRRLTAFDFQLVLDNSGIPAVTAQPASIPPPAARPKRRGSGNAKSVLLQTDPCDLHVEIIENENAVDIYGQVLERGTGTFFEDVEARVLENGHPRAIDYANDVGEFHFRDLRPGPLELEVFIPSKQLRILASISDADVF